MLSLSLWNFKYVYVKATIAEIVNLLTDTIKYKTITMSAFIQILMYKRGCIYVCKYFLLTSAQPNSMIFSRRCK